MARSGITKAQVKSAQDALRAQGHAVTIDSVRQALGNTGSKTTISRYLQELAQDEPLSAQRLPALSDELIQLIAQLAERLHNEAAATVEAHQAAHDAARLQWESERQDVRREIEQLQQQHRAWQIELANQTQHNAELQQQLQAQAIRQAQYEEKVSALQVQLHERQQQISSLEEKHRHARDALEHFRESVKTQRDQEIQRHEHQIQQLQAELRVSQHTISVKQQECTSLKEQTLQLSAELQHARQSVKTVEQQLVALQHNHQQAEQQLYRKDIELAGLQKEFGPLQEQCAAALAKVASLQENEQAWLQEKAALSASLNTQQQLWQTFSTVNAMSTPPRYGKGEDVIVIDAEHALYDRIGQVERAEKKGDGSVKYSVCFDGEIYALSDSIIKLA